MGARASFFRSLLVSAAVLATGGVMAQTAPALCLRGPAEPVVAFHGLPSFDGAGSGAMPMMYPAPNVAGMLAGVITHGLLMSGGREREKAAIVEVADRVLLPYQADLARFRHDELLTAALAQVHVAGSRRLAPAGAAALAGETAVDSAPVFYMTQDRRALVLINTISVRPAGAATPVAKMVRVVSAPRPVDPASGWISGDKNLLREASVAMQARAIDIALADHAVPASTPFRTVRYEEGGSERMERAQVIAEQCEQLLMRTLRGEYMAVPRKADSDNPLCKAKQEG